jgi:hypothetical protein
MDNLVKAAAKKAGVPSEVLDVIGLKFISEAIEEFPDLLLPAIMQTLKQEYQKNGLGWINENVPSLRKQFLHLKKLYTPT